MAALRQPIRLVTFDALYTIIVPRLPIHTQYSQTFEPYLGVLDPVSLKQSFRLAFRSLERERPVYGEGSQAWWSEVIRRTALGAGADETALDASLAQIVPRLLDRFSSKEGYRAFEDAIPVVEFFHALDIQTAIVSNADSRIRSVLRDLDFPASIGPVILSEEEGVEKPSPEIFRRILTAVNSKLGHKSPITAEQTLHVGDELEADYHGALAAGMKALLLRRAGPDGDQTHQTMNSFEFEGAVPDLRAVAQWVARYNNDVSLVC